MSRATATASPRFSEQVLHRSQQVREVGLRLVGPVRERTSRIPFAVVAISMVVLSFAGLIGMRPMLERQAFQIYELEHQLASLDAERSGLRSTVETLQSPGSVAERGLAEGMVPNTNPVFLRLDDRVVIGTPAPALRGTNVRRAD